FPSHVWGIVQGCDRNRRAQYSLQERHAGGAGRPGGPHRHEFRHGFEPSAPHSRGKASRACHLQRGPKPGPSQCAHDGGIRIPLSDAGRLDGLWGPRGTPAHIVNRLNAEITASVTTPAMKAAMKNLDFEPKYGSPQDFATFILDEIEAWTPAAKAAGIIPK